MPSRLFAQAQRQADTKPLILSRDRNRPGNLIQDLMQHPTNPARISTASASSTSLGPDCGESAQIGGIAPPVPPIAGLALRPIPKALLQATLSAVLHTVLKRHPDILDRLQPIGFATIAMDVTDLPFLLVFRTDSSAGALKLVERSAVAPVAATIRGSLPVLLSLLQGKADGDALFFSRALTIEGDTAIVVALRNIIDNAEIDLLDDIAAGFGRLAPVARNIGLFSARAAIGLSRPLLALQAAINKPIARELLALRSTIEQLQGSAGHLCKDGSRVPQAR